MADKPPRWYVVFLHPSGLIVCEPADTTEEADEIISVVPNWFLRVRVPGEAVNAALRERCQATPCPTTP